MSTAEASKKVAEQDIPKILAAIQSAIEAKRKWTLVVEGSDNGGILDIQLTQKKSYK
jgi:hypothetical protein